MISTTASASGTFIIGGDLPVYRLGYGTMRLVGEGAWGEPENPDPVTGRSFWTASGTC